MKQCTKCNKFKAFSEFNKKGSGYQYSCKQCNSEYLKQHYKDNKQYYSDKSKNYKTKSKEFIWEIKCNSKCVVCGYNNPASLDFHHRDPKVKEINISYICRYGWSEERILKEIDKCDILCSNCHREFHHKEGSSSG